MLEVKVVVPKKLKEDEKEALLHYAQLSGEDLAQYKGKGSWLDKIIEQAERLIQIPGKELRMEIMGM